MKWIDSYIIEKLHLNKDINVHSFDKEVDSDFRKLMNLLKKEGADEEIRDDLLNLAEFDEHDDLYYEFNEGKFRIFLRTIVNYDWISLRENGKIDINNSNHKEIAKIISKYVTPEIGIKVYKSFSWH